MVRSRPSRELSTTTNYLVRRGASARLRRAWSATGRFPRRSLRANDERPERIAALRLFVRVISRCLEVELQAKLHLPRIVKRIAGALGAQEGVARCEAALEVYGSRGRSAHLVRASDRRLSHQVRLWLGTPKWKSWLNTEFFISPDRGHLAHKTTH